jgi:hypothetical protein
MAAKLLQDFVIVGVTQSGKKFRPSDWADRLSGIMAIYSPDSGVGRSPYLRRGFIPYSPYVRPGFFEGEKCVFVDAHIHDLEPMAYSFLVSFAKDNALKVVYDARPDDSFS